MNTSAMASGNKALIRATALAVAMANLLAYAWNYTRKPVFWDADVYIRALTDLSRSLDPYRLDVQNVYVYPPITLQLLSGLTPDTFGWAYTGFALLCAVAFMATLKAQKLASGKPMAHTQLAEGAVLALGLGGVGVFAIATGNATTCLHLLIITLLVRAAQDNRWTPLLMAAIWAASLVKPYLLSYALVAPFAVNMRRPVIWSGAVFAMTAAVYLGYAIFDAQHMTAFLSAIQHQLRGGLDGGIGVYGILCQLGLPSPWAMAWQVAYALGVCWTCHGLMRASAGNTSGTVGAAVLCAVLINPRLKEYDLFPALCLWLTLTPRWPGFGTHMLIALGITSMVLPFKVLHIDTQVHKFMLFNSGSWVFLATSCLCWCAHERSAMKGEFSAPWQPTDPAASMSHGSSP